MTPRWMAPPLTRSTSAALPARIFAMRLLFVVSHTLASYLSMHVVPDRTASAGHGDPAALGLLVRSRHATNVNAEAGTIRFIADLLCLRRICEFPSFVSPTGHTRSVPMP